MTASNAANAQSPLNKRTAALRAFRDRLHTILPLRLLLLILGVGSIGYGQYLMEQRLPQGTPSMAAELWNITYRLDIPNYDSAYKALPFLIGGAFVCALATVPSSWKTPITNWTLKELSHEGRPEQSLTIVIGILSFRNLS